MIRACWDWPASHMPVLVAPGVGVVTCPFANRREAAIRLADRVANGEAFPGEVVARMPRRIAREAAVREGERMARYFGALAAKAGAK